MSPQPHALAVVAAALALSAGCGGAPADRPRFVVEPSGPRYPPLPPDSRVEIHRSGEPQVSFREVGRVTASCPVKHWVGGRELSGRPICREGLRQGARLLGGQAVIELELDRTRPPWAPERPWLVMRGTVVRMVR